MSKKKERGRENDNVIMKYNKSENKKVVYILSGGSHWGTFLAMASIACPAAIRVSHSLLLKCTIT